MGDQSNDKTKDTAEGSKKESDEKAKDDPEGNNKRGTSIGDVISDFVAEIVGLRATSPIVMKAIFEAARNTGNRINEFLERHGKRRTQGDTEVIDLERDYVRGFTELAKQASQHELAQRVMPRTFLVSLVSQYDAFLGALLRAIFLSRPEMLTASDKTLSLSQLVQFSSIEEAREHILEKEVESVLRKSHADHFQWMENKFDMPLRKGLMVWPEFIELTERRHLFVHSNGKTTSQYLKTCKEHGVIFEEQPKIGEMVTAPPKYFRQCCNTVLEIGFKLGQVLWRKFNPDDLENADLNLQNIGYEQLYEKNYPLARVVFEFGTGTLKKHSSEEYRRLFVVNRALAYKWNGDQARAAEIIRAEDWTALRTKFRLAEAVILDNFPRALEIMRELGKDEKEVTRDAYRTWPLFKEFRKTVEFQTTYEQIFGEPLNKLEVDAAAKQPTEVAKVTVDGPTTKKE